MVKREAERYGVSIVGSEIVGLIPKRAIEMTADFYLQFENFSPAQVLENRMETSLRGSGLPSGPAELAAHGAAVSGCRGAADGRTGRRLGCRAGGSARRESGPDGGGTIAQEKIQAALCRAAQRKRLRSFRPRRALWPEAIDAMQRRLNR